MSHLQANIVRTRHHFVRSHVLQNVFDRCTQGEKCMSTLSKIVGPRAAHGDVAHQNDFGSTRNSVRALRLARSESRARQACERMSRTVVSVSESLWSRQDEKTRVGCTHGQHVRHDIAQLPPMQNADPASILLRPVFVLCVQKL